MTAVDWLALGRKLGEIESGMIHGDNSDLHGDEFRAEALRRLLENRPGWITLEEHYRVLDLNRRQDRANGEAAKATLARLSAEYERKMRDSAREYAEAIRYRATESEVPSRYRREGVLLAAEWLDPRKGDAGDE